MLISQFQFNQEEMDILYESLRRKRFYALGRVDKSDNQVFDDVAKIDALMEKLKPNYTPEDWSIQILKDEEAFKNANQ